MAKLWLMVGAPGSGKSTYLKTHNIPRSVSVSRDLIRFDMLQEGEPYFSHENEVYRDFVKVIAEMLDSGKYDHVFADQTSLNEAARAKLLNALKDRRATYDELNAIVFKLPLETLLERNMQRIGREYVPERAVIDMYNRMTIPTKKEGFDNIYIYNGKDWYYGK